jgi:hypothetical protein
MPQPPEEEPSAPTAFRVERTLPPGRYPLTRVFPGLEKLPCFRRLCPEEPRRQMLATETCVEVVDQDLWMYVAPHEDAVQRRRRRGWKPVVSETDCVVVGRSHLAESPSIVLYLDILHELCHVCQRQEGRELWDETYAYVDRPTEVEAYRFAVEEARRLGVSDRFLAGYLEVEWVEPAEHQRLLRTLGVSPA